MQPFVTDQFLTTLKSLIQEWDSDRTVITILAPKCWSNLKAIYQIPLLHEMDNTVSVFINYDGYGKILEMVMLEFDVPIEHSALYLAKLQEYEQLDIWSNVA